MSHPLLVDAVSPLRLMFRLPLLAVHVAVGAPMALAMFLPGVRGIRFGGLTLRARAHRRWARMLLGIFGLSLSVRGRLPEGPFMLVANHISWLDIVLLQAVWPVRFVAKSEIRRWPVVGWMTTLSGTVYMERGQAGSRERVVAHLGEHLRRGERIAIFPEGGIHPEAGVGRFHARLLAAAVAAGVPVVPVALRYQAGRDLHREVVFASESFLRNALRLLGRPAWTGRVMIGAPLAAAGARRSELARAAHAQVRTFYENHS